MYRIIECGESNAFQECLPKLFFFLLFKKKIAVSIFYLFIYFFFFIIFGLSTKVNIKSSHSHRWYRDRKGIWEADHRIWSAQIKIKGENLGIDHRLTPFWSFRFHSFVLLLWEIFISCTPSHATNHPPLLTIPQKICSNLPLYIIRASIFWLWLTQSRFVCFWVI